ncbi:MAG: RDD family protein [Vulcanimicrobiota bacterium]
MNVSASRWARLQAAVLDWIFCWWPMFTVIFACSILEASTPGRRFADDVTGALFLAGMVLSAVLVVRNLSLLARTGQTWGKRHLNLLVVMEDGRRASSSTLYWRALSPYVLMFVPIANVVTYFDCWFILGEARRCLHDRLAGTIVVEADSYHELAPDGTGLSPSYDDIGFTRVR